jgi:hypothetical protein
MIRDAGDVPLLRYTEFGEQGQAVFVDLGLDWFQADCAHVHGWDWVG